MSEDAPEDWSPVGIEKAIYKVVQRIAKGVGVCAEAHGAFLEADRNFDKEFAIKYTTENGAAHERKYKAQLETMDSRARRDGAEVAYQWARQKMRALDAELEALRSIGVSVRQAYQNAGRGEC